MESDTHCVDDGQIRRTKRAVRDDTICTNEAFMAQENSNGITGHAEMTSTYRSESVDMGDIENRESPKQHKETLDKTADITSVFQLFRFADEFDMCLIAFGSIAAIINGLCHPAILLVFGEIITGFIYFEQIPHNLTVAYNMSLAFDVDDYTDVFGNTKELALYCCLIGIVCLVTGSVQYMCWDISMERQMLKIRSSLYTSIVHRNIAWFDEHNAGELDTSFTESLAQLEAGMGKEVASFLQWMTSCVGAYILAIVKGWKLTFACLTFSPLLIITAGILVKWLRNLSIKENQAYSMAGNVATEVLTAIKTVMSFNGQNKESERYNSNLDTAAKLGIKKGLAMGLGMGFIWFFMFCMVATSFGYGVKLSLEGEPGFDRPGDVITIYMAVMTGSVFLAQAFPIIEVMSKSKAAATKVFAIIGTKPSIASSTSDCLRPKVIKGSIELRNVRFEYPSRKGVEVLKGVSIHMKPGQTVAIVGHSGCGKSTIIQLIERFYEVSAGEILLDGTDVCKLNVKWLRNQIGLVSQEPVLFGTTIRENIQCGRMDLTDENIHAAARQANIHEFIRHLPEGYGTMVGQSGTQLSGGQKQRIALARALVRNPKILLLDEATSALDNESEALVQKALENAQKGRTTVVVAHRLSTIKNSDLIVVMENGQIIETGTHVALMAKCGLYVDLVRNQTRHSTDNELTKLEQDLSEDNSDIVKPHVPVYEGLSDPTQKYSIPHKMINSDGPMDKDEEEVVRDVSFRRLIRMNSSEWHFILGGFLCSSAVGVLFPALTVLASEYLRVFTRSEDERIEFSLIMTGIIMAVSVVNTLLRVGQYVCLAVSGEILTTRLRKLTFMSFLKQDMAFFDDPKQQVSTLTYTLSTDTAQVQGATGNKIGYMTEAAACIISALIISFTASWRMALVVIIFLPLMVVAGILNGRLMVLRETIDNIKLVTSLTMEDTLTDKYIGTITTAYRRAVKRCLLTSLLIGFSSSLIYINYAASLTYGSYLMQKSFIPFYIVIRIFYMLLVSGQHIGRMAVQSGDFSKANQAASRLFRFIDKVPVIDSSGESGHRPEELHGNLSFQNVGFKYPCRTGVPVLNNLSLEVRAGETVALVGASGCGKTTHVSLIERFYDPSAGKVIVDGKDISKLDLKWLRSQIGFVEQEPVLFDCSIASNITYGIHGRTVQMDEIIAAARSANIHSFINALPNGYETNVGNKGTQLSGGQKQRIAIARAIIYNPRILLLDEATSALDSNTEQIVQQALEGAQKGRTCVVIAHRLSTIQNADKIAIIHEGSAVEMGTHSELLAAKGMYYEFLNSYESKGKNQL